MAGSWEHMTTRSGKLRSNETFTGMIENLGDAYEAAEQCYGMVQFLAERLAGLDTEPCRLSRQEWIGEAREYYRTGLKLGGVQRG